MSFTGHENHSILLDDAAKMTLRYRDQMNEGQIKGGFFGTDALRQILDQEGCVGIRYYYGLDDSNAQVLVLVGVDGEENDMENQSLAEVSRPCPPRCGRDNKLNS